MSDNRKTTKRKRGEGKGEEVKNGRKEQEKIEVPEMELCSSTFVR